MSSPIVHELPTALDPLTALQSIADWPQVVLFESVRREGRQSRYSFLTADPLWTSRLMSPRIDRDPFAEIRQRLPDGVTTVTGLPPFQGGVVGLLSYEFGRCFEKLPELAHDEFGRPAMVAGLYDWVLCWDHEQQRSWIIVHNLDGRPDTERLQQVHSALERGPVRSQASGLTARAKTISTPAHPVSGVITSNFSRPGYQDAVARVIELIKAGDVFQANLSQRLLTPATIDPLSLYERLRSRNPAPFAAYYAVDDWAIVSASPERFLQVHQEFVTTRPIKGTRQRRITPEADLITRDELRESEKDRAENVMIVDLLRNDLSRVCRAGSIAVPELCEVEAYETVQHLVSEVRGELADGKDFWDLLQATFPGGSITGAPKVRAMEIITELEQVARGPYCGCLFYSGFDGTADSNILIRTFTHCGGWIQCPVGGGIVVQSDPADEYAETMHKAEGMLRALK